MLAERPIRILRSLGSLNKGREVALGRGEEEGVVHESVSGFQAYPVFSLSVSAPRKEVSLGKVVSSSLSLKLLA